MCRTYYPCCGCVSGPVKATLAAAVLRWNVSAQRWPHQVGGVDELQRPVPGIDDAARFHEAWEARIFGLAQVVGRLRLYSTDEFRHVIERIDPAEYAQLTYFEKWLAAIEELVVASGAITADELREAQGHRLHEHGHDHPPHAAPTIAAHPDEHLHAPAARERFAPGDAVRLVRGLGEHHRLPDWARARRGVVRAVRGRFPLPDLIVAGASEHTPYALYAVEVRARDAFGDADPRDTLILDVYDPYLEPTEEARP
jgi:nitrile hydratase subunit beta